MSEWRKVKIGALLNRSKISIDIEDDGIYKRVTIKTKHQGISLRDEEVGKKIGTKKQFILKAGQFLMSKIDARYGAFGIAGADVDDAIITGNFWAYDINQNLTTVEWINNYTNSPAFYDLCERASSGITHRKYLNENAFLNHELLIPPIEKQHEILLSLRKRKEYAIRLTKEINQQQTYLAKLRQSILQEAIEGKLTADWRAAHPVCLGDPNTDAAALLAAIQTEKQTLIAQGKLKKEKPLPPISNHEMPFALPEGWRWVSLLDVSFISGGMQKTQSRTPIKNFYPYLGVQNVQRGYLNLSQIKYFEATETELKKLKLVKNDLLIIEGNGSINEIGRCAIWNEEIENCIHQNHIMRCRPIISSQSSFIITVLNSNFGIAQMQEKARTTTGLFNLSVGKLSTVIIPLPPLAEQHEIVARVDRLLASVNALEQQVAERQRHAEQLMQAVLQEAFAG